MSLNTFSRCAAITTVAFVVSLMSVANYAATVTVDFSQHVGSDLVKNKFGVYQTPFFFKTHPPQKFDMVPLLREAGVRDLRYEFAWGKPDAYAFDQIRGTADNPIVDFRPLDPFILQLMRAKVTPLFALTYDPLPLQTSTDWQSWKDRPKDLDCWTNIISSYTAHYSVDLHVPLVRYEVWNEPDLPGDGGKVFFNGSPQDYGRLYATTAPAVKAASTDRRYKSEVGGPAIAYDPDYITKSELLNQPIDFVSVHAYGNYDAQIRAVREALGAHKLPIFVTEYASFNEFGLDHPISRYPAAAAFFRDVKSLLEYTDVTKVYWAQWIDSPIGMLTDDLHRKALFNAYKIYQTMLPVSRVRTLVDPNSKVDAMASSDGVHSATVIWNNGKTDATNVTVNLAGLPLSPGTIYLYRIDSHHASWVDDKSTEQLHVDQQWRFSQQRSVWTGEIPAESVVFLTNTREH